MDESTLIIGATGFLGEALCRRFAMPGAKLAGTTRDATKAASLKSIGVVPVIVDMEGDIDFTALLAPYQTIVFAPQLLVVSEHEVVRRILTAMEGSGKTFLFTSGTGLVAHRTDGHWSDLVLAEDDPFVPLKYLALRADTEQMVREASARGVRGMVIRPPGIWGHGGTNMIKPFFELGRKTGSVGYLGRGLNAYSNVHVDDLADLFFRAASSGRSDALYHAVAGEVNNRTIAEAVARELGIGCRSVSFEEAEAVIGRFTTLVFFSMSSRTTSWRTREELGWSPTHLDILEDVSHPAYRI